MPNAVECVKLLERRRVLFGCGMVEDGERKGKKKSTAKSSSARKTTATAERYGGGASEGLKLANVEHLNAPQ